MPVILVTLTGFFERSSLECRQNLKVLIRNKFRQSISLTNQEIARYEKTLGMESRKHVQFTKKAPGTKWMKKLIQLCGLNFLVHESKVEGACSAVKKNVSVIQARDG